MTLDQVNRLFRNAPFHAGPFPPIFNCRCIPIKRRYTWNPIWHNTYFGRFMSKQEIYRSSTLGPIPLSFTGRHLLQTLRDEMQRLINKLQEQQGCYHTNDWKPVSEARGRIAEYMSKLEQRVPPSPADVLQKLCDADLIGEFLRRGLKQEPVTYINLPPIPDGYELKHVGDITTIAPLQEIRAAATTTLKMNFAIDDATELRTKYRVHFVGRGENIWRKVALKPEGAQVYAGTLLVEANSMESALQLAVETAGKHGFLVDHKDFSVQFEP
jgi:hypothetical protein